MSTLSPPAVVRLCLGVIYVHFGLLKLFPDLCPAEELAQQTILRLGIALPPETILSALSGFEIGLGVLLLLRLVPRLTLALFTLHMLGTLSPLVILPEHMFQVAPFAPTLEGQYLLKNLVLLPAGWMLLLEGRSAPTPAPQPVEAS